MTCLFIGLPYRVPNYKTCIPHSDKVRISNLFLLKYQQQRSINKESYAPLMSSIREIKCYILEPQNTVVDVKQYPLAWNGNQIDLRCQENNGVLNSPRSYIYILSIELSVEVLFQSDPEILSQPIAQVPFCSSVRLPSSSIINLDKKYITRAVCKI